MNFKANIKCQNLKGTDVKVQTLVCEGPIDGL